MATVPESTNQRNPFDENNGPLPSFGNGAPYMTMFSLPVFTIGMLVWLFLTPMVLNMQVASQ